MASRQPSSAYHTCKTSEQGLSIKVQLHPDIGSGTFGTVFNAYDQENGAHYAAKKISISAGGGKLNKDVEKKALDEIKSVKKLQNCPFVIQIIGTQIEYEGKCIWIFMELCELGDLELYCNSKNPNFTKRCQIMYQCAVALAYMHSFYPPIVHRDVKPQNVLMRRQGDQDVVRLSDFGMVKLVEHSMKGSLVMNTFGGSKSYMAPEFWVSFDKPLIEYTKAVDTFAAGLLFQVLLKFNKDSPHFMPRSMQKEREKKEMIIGMEMYFAHRDNTPMPDVVTVTPTDTVPERQLKQLIQRMTKYEREERPSMSEVENALSELVLALDAEEPADVDDEFGAAGPQEYLPFINEDTSSTNDSNEDVDNRTEADQGTETVTSQRTLSYYENQTLSVAELQIGAGEHSFQVNDVVHINGDESFVQSAQAGSGGWNQEMKRCLGQLGVVTNSDGQRARVSSNGVSYVFNSTVLTPVPKTDMNSLKEGDMMLIKQDRTVIETLQKQPGNGGWKEDMARVLGCPGKITALDKDSRIVRVENQIGHGIVSYVWCADCLKPLKETKK